MPWNFAESFGIARKFYNLNVVEQKTAENVVEYKEKHKLATLLSLKNPFTNLVITWLFLGRFLILFVNCHFRIVIKI